MYKFIAVAFVGFLMIQGSLAKPKQNTKQTTQIQEIAAKADQLVKNVTTALEGNLPTSKQIIDSYTGNAQKLLDSFKSMTDNIKTQLQSHQGDIDGVLKQVSENLHSTRANIEKALGPDGQKTAQNIKDSVDKGLKDAVAQMDKLGKAVEPEATKVKEDLLQAAKAFLDNVVEVSQDLQTKIAQRKN